MGKKKYFSKRQNQSSTDKTPNSLDLIDSISQQNYVKKIEESYGAKFKFIPTQLFINSKQKIYFSTLYETPEFLTRINAQGLYLGTLVDSGHVRLSQEGSQLLTRAKFNFVVLKEDSLASYVAGENLFFDEVDVENISDEIKAPFLIVYDHDGNALGTVSKKEKYYLNYLSKGRKMNFNRVF